MQNTIRIIIASGRDFRDYSRVKKKADIFISEIKPTETIIIFGGEKRVDSLGEKYARENNLQVELFKEDWSKFGRAAGPKRNELMDQYTSHLLAFWNEESKGTKPMISLAKREKLIVRTCRI